MDVQQVINDLKETPIDQVFMESVSCSVYRKADGEFDYAKLISDVWDSALDNAATNVKALVDKTVSETITEIEAYRDKHDKSYHDQEMGYVVHSSVNQVLEIVRKRMTAEGGL